MKPGAKVEIPGYTGVARDPECQRMEAKLRLQSAALEAAAIGMAITDLEGTSSGSIRLSAALTGYTGGRSRGPESPHIEVRQAW